MKLNKDEITAEALKPLLGKEMLVLTTPYAGSLSMSRTATGIAENVEFEPDVDCRFLTRLSPSGEYAEFCKGNSSGMNQDRNWCPVVRIIGIEVLA